MQLNTNKLTLDSSIDICDLILNEIGAYVFLKDRDRKYVYVNEITRKLFGRELEQIIGSDDSEYFDLNELSELIKNDTRVLDYGETVIEEEANTIKTTGKVRVYQSIKKPVYNNNNEIIGLLGISTDITDIYNLKEDLKKQAATDSLTGLYNRRFFLETAERIFSESGRYDNPLALIIMDIDLFKSINDSYGHPVGDVVLQFISKHISGFIRKEDVFARIGGEEFAFLLPNTHITSAQDLAEKIRISVSEQTISGEWNGTIKPKLSLGISHRRETDSSFDAVYIRADKALYTAKHKGRNRVCVNC